MNTVKERILRFGLICLGGLMSVWLSCCANSTIDESLTEAPTYIPAETQTSVATEAMTVLPSGDLAFVSRCCRCENADVQLLTLQNGELTPISADLRDDRELSWSPDGQRLGILSYETDKRTLRIVDVSTLEVQWETNEPFFQFAWSADGTGIFYLDREEGLHLYDLLTGIDTHLLDGISGFSVSPNGRWLGLSIRDSEYMGSFTFRVLDLTSNLLLTTIDPDEDLGRLGANRSVWSPEGDRVAVVFGPAAAQMSKIVIYAVREGYLETTVTTIARETYQRDYDKDLPSVGFGDLAWSPDGQKLLVIRSATDAHPGGEMLLFDTSLASHRRLPFGENVTQLAWADRGVAFVAASNSKDGSCTGYLSGEIWFADIESLEAWILTTDTLYTARPAWRP
jgi:WD40 repeat protein